MLCLALSATAAPADPLEKSFVSPPDSSRPWVYWMILDGSLTKDGITADLEAMARVGIGGALYLEVRQGTPPGPVKFASPEWMEMIRHICNEAKRLGLEVSFNNDAGWTGSGGPWITPEMSMQKVVWSEVVAEAGSPIVLPKPEGEKNYYRDVAVLAMPLPSVDQRCLLMVYHDVAAPRWRLHGICDGVIAKMLTQIGSQIFLQVVCP